MYMELLRTTLYDPKPNPNPHSRNTLFNHLFFVKKRITGMKVWVWAILYAFIRSWTLLHDPKHSHTISSQTLISFFLTHSNFTDLYHLLTPFWSVLNLKQKSPSNFYIPTSKSSCQQALRHAHWVFLNYLSAYKYYCKMNRKRLRRMNRKVLRRSVILINNSMAESSVQQCTI